MTIAIGPGEAKRAPERSRDGGAQVVHNRKQGKREKFFIPIERNPLKSLDQKK
jgi:hypothetical protein